MPRIKALTLWEPWASLIALGFKCYETRSWPTQYRGPLAIHAAKRKVRIAEVQAIVTNTGGHLMHFDFPVDYPLGCVVAVVELVECWRTSGSAIPSVGRLERACGDWSFGRYAWGLANIRPLEVPMPAKGQQGLWDWDAP